VTYSFRTLGEARTAPAGGIKARFAALVERLRKRFDPNGGVQVRARLTYAIGKATIAMGDDATAFRGLRARPLTPPGLCIEVQNHGKDTIIVTEVGLTRGEDGPQIALRDPHLHDSGPWPRHLAPGESVVAHFGSGLAGHKVLPDVRRSYALSIDGRHYFGPARAASLRCAHGGASSPGQSRRRLARPRQDERKLVAHPCGGLFQAMAKLDDR